MQDECREGRVDIKSEVWSVQSVRAVEWVGEGCDSGYSNRGSRFSSALTCTKVRVE